MRTSMVIARPAHIPHLAAHMRQADREEVWAWGEHAPDEALRASAAVSVLCWTGMVDDEPVCMFGAGVEGRLGVPWMLGTDRLDSIPRTFGRQSRVALGLIQDVFPRLANWSDARHEKAHTWLRWLGFTLGEPQPMGALGLPFVPFVMGIDHV